MLSKTTLFAAACGAMVLVGATLSSGEVFAQGSTLAGSSLASSLVQSRTQVRILKHDDKQDASCREKRFLDAEVITQPTVNTVSATVSERKWQEQWTLERCGEPVGYRVFFTEVGDGGAYFSFVQTN